MNSTIPCFAIGIALSTALTSLHSATVNFDDYWNGTPGNFKSAFNSAQNAAGTNGTVKFSSKTYKTSTQVEITKSGLKLDGSSIENCKILFDSAAFGANTIKNYIFKVQVSGVKIEDLTLSGPFLTTTEDGLDDRAPVVTRGLLYCVSLSGSAKNFSATRVKMRNCGNGVRGSVGYTFDGGRLTDCRFERFNDAVLFKDNSSTKFKSMTSKFIVNNCDWDQNPYEDDYGRGFTHDFGNYLSDLTIVDLKWSQFKNNTMDQAVRWNVDFNRVKNLSIQSNVMYGGGAGNNPDWFHPLHFEDHCQSITIGTVGSDTSLGNEIHQLIKQGSNEPGQGSSWMIQVTGEHNENYPEPFKLFNIGNNEFNGEVWRGLRCGSGGQSFRIEKNDFNLNTNDSVLHKIIFVNKYNSFSNSVDTNPNNRLNGSTMTDQQESSFFQIE